MFRSVTYSNNMGDLPARVNRVTGELQLNPALWAILPKDYKDFILYHEEGHLVLQTKDEAKANQYAIEKYLPIADLTDQEAARRIRVMCEITDPDNFLLNGKRRPEVSSENESDFDPVTIVLSLFGQASKITDGIISRKNAENAARLQVEVNTAAAQLQAANNKRLIIWAIIIGSLLIAGTLIYKFR